MKDLRTIKELVENILENKIETRDNDSILVIEVWKLELKNLGYHPTLSEIKVFYDLYSNNKLSNSESITRVRRKLQEHNPRLRGDLYGVRHDYTDEIKHQIKTFPKPVIQESKTSIIKTNCTKKLKRKSCLEQQSFLEGFNI